MKPDSYAWPPPSEIRNVAPGRRMAELSTTAAKRCWSPDDDDAPPAPPAEKRQQFVSERSRAAVLELLTFARDTGKAMTRGQIRHRLLLSEKTVSRALIGLLADGLVIQAGQSNKLTNNKTMPTFRARHYGEDAPPLPEPPTLATTLRPHLVRARRRDPSTSQQAAESMRTAATEQGARVFNALQAIGEAGAEQIGQRIGMDAYAVRKRLPELEQAGLIETTGDTRRTASGRSERVWRVAL